MLLGPGAAELLLCTSMGDCLDPTCEILCKTENQNMPTHCRWCERARNLTQESQGEEPKAPGLQGEVETPHSRMESLAGALGSFCGPQGDGPVAPAVQPDVDKD